MVVQYKDYSADNLFSLLFKHLIESKGLNALILFTNYEKRAKDFERNDGYI